MDLQLTDATALVTGSSAGIGFAAATALAREGARVVLNGRDAQRLDAARERLLGLVPGADVSAVAADIATEAGAEALLAAVPDVDVLVNNAATFGPHPFTELTDADWRQMLESNLLSGVRLTRHHLPRMLERGQGRIVFVASDAAAQAQVDQLHYSVSKTAVVALARGLAEMTRGTQVTVNSVLPGPTATEGVGRVMDGIAAQTGLTHEAIERQLFETTVPSSLIGRLADPQEVADLIVFLASSRAPLTNGAAVRAEGGIVRSIL